MVALFVTSPEKGSGKTTLCAGLGKYLQNTGKKVGYLKPVAGGGDSDAGFMKNILSLDETVETLSDKNAYEKVSQGKDVVIVEGDYQSAAEIAKALEAKVLIVEAYSGKPSKKEDKYTNLGELLLGVIINKVPESRIEQAHSTAGEKVIGIIPEDRVLLALTMGELAERIQGEVLRGAEQSAALVENIMLGALAVDHGPEYFGRKENKMVVLRSDRSDMQMAAMETSTRCLVITGDTPLKPVVLDRAEEKNMPIILVKEDVATVVETIEGALGGGKFSQQNKLPRIVELVEQNVDMEKVKKGLGL
ncbi:DRTGG domain-containing protein [Chloroflexota bacterium]